MLTFFFRKWLSEFFFGFHLQHSFVSLPTWLCSARCHTPLREATTSSRTFAEISSPPSTRPGTRSAQPLVLQLVVPQYLRWMANVGRPLRGTFVHACSFVAYDVRSFSSLILFLFGITWSSVPNAQVQKEIWFRLTELSLHVGHRHDWCEIWSVEHAGCRISRTSFSTMTGQQEGTMTLDSGLAWWTAHLAGGMGSNG